MNYRQPAKKDWTADQNVPRSFILFETVKHFLTAFFSSTKPDSVILYTTDGYSWRKLSHAGSHFSRNATRKYSWKYLWNEQLIRFFSRQKLPLLKWFMTMKFTNIALQTFIEIKNYCVRSTAFFASIIKVRIGLYGGSQDKRSCFQELQWL